MDYCLSPNTWNLGNRQFFRQLPEELLRVTLGLSQGGLDNLEQDYDLIQRKRPYLSGENSRKVKYIISDNFINFWFRFIYKYRSAVEIQNMQYAQDKVFADYETYSGLILEKLIRQLYMESGLYNIVTNYWDKDETDEIDLIAVNEIDKIAIIGETKRNKAKIDLKVLEKKTAKIIYHHKGWNINFIGT